MMALPSSSLPESLTANVQSTRGRLVDAARRPRAGRLRGAVVAGPYRYLLWRTWDTRLPCLLWVLLNPSVADADADDPTLRRCQAFSAAWGYGALEIVNLFGLRTQYPRGLLDASDPVGPANDQFILAASRRASAIIAAWGNHGAYQQRERIVMSLLACGGSAAVLCLGMTKRNQPCHPLYTRHGTAAISYVP